MMGSDLKSFSMPVTFLDLPPEVFLDIVAHFPEEELRRNILALSRALAGYPIIQDGLFTKIILTRPEQVHQLYRRFRIDNAAQLVKEFALEIWDADADLLVGLIRKMTRLRRLKIFIGPRNFTPEHLHDILRLRPGTDMWQDLSHLELRFKPYVEKATYQPFLAGSYYDRMIVALSVWPKPTLSHLSIVQEPMDPKISRNQKFAQPIVFFHLGTITDLVISRALSRIQSFRLRIPARQTARYLTSTPRSIPLTRVLDLSTSIVTDTDIEDITARYHQLQHIIADNCTIIRSATFAEGEWENFAKRCALVGVKRAKDREKVLKPYLTMTVPADEAFRHAHPIFGHHSKTKKGRKGLSTATISIRDRDDDAKPDSNIKTVTIRDRTRILPTSPTLRSLCVTAKADKHDLIREEWQRGWANGIAQLITTRLRLRQSATNGWKVFRFTDEIDYNVPVEDLEKHAYGLERLSLEAENEWGLDESSLKEAPILCLAGTEYPHQKGCGHEYFELY